MRTIIFLISLIYSLPITPSEPDTMIFSVPPIEFKPVTLKITPTLTPQTATQFIRCSTAVAGLIAIVLGLFSKDNEVVKIGTGVALFVGSCLYHETTEPHTKDLSCTPIKQ